ncbi:universal stress protein [Achromobacter denitrificans]|uniref:universal stress protein n=1 Tax=Achromobacter denitrificans TaxID=32002 RepID=UPI000B4CF274|nr:universal stress protein [Achromobacter denitrificans]ASC66709.1 universal stress protein [Achromobacter denitrificans]
MFRRIAVHLDHGVDMSRRLEFSLRLAKAHDAHLTGIFASYVAPGYFYDEAGLWVRSMDTATQINEQGRTAAQAAFSEAARDLGVSASWRQGEGSPADCVARHARCSDVLVVSQDNPDDLDAAIGNDFVEQVLMSVGRPVIVLPTLGTFNAVGARVLYCWDRGRESARAIADAAPLLRNAHALAVLTLGEGADDASALEVPFEDLAAYCACHGFPLPEHEFRNTRDIDVGDAILSAAADFSADLIVMGAYGHSRMRQWIMGGATRTLLAAMTMPVLFSH